MVLFITWFCDCCYFIFLLRSYFCRNCLRCRRGGFRSDDGYFCFSFAQGAATSIETADVLVDGFGVIAMVAMAPVFSLMVLGLIFKYRKKSTPVKPAPSPIEEEEIYKPSTLQHCLIAIADRGFGD